jgi:PAB-dependent poly(A)-specific ribonuclease subunit 3
MGPDDPRHKAVPLPYCNAYCLDYDKNPKTPSPQQRRVTSRSSFGYPSATFQVTNRDDGHLYCLKRFDNVRSVSPKIAAAVSDRWNTALAVSQHPGVVPLYQCFTAQRAVFFVHQYIPGARSLAERLASPGGGPLPENMLWSCLAQLTSAIRTIHGHNLAVRTLRLQHVLYSFYPGADVDPNVGSASCIRVRLGNLGVVDALEFEARKHAVDLQMEDIRDLGRLIVSLATGTDLFAPTNESNNNSAAVSSILNRCEQYMAQRYSRELHNLAMTLIMSQPRPPSIQDISRAIAAARTFDEQDAAYRACDRTERALAGEYESGRAFRLLLKLGFINERPELGPNRRWTQSGDCYVLTLFRDYGTRNYVTLLFVLRSCPCCFYSSCCLSDQSFIKQTAQVIRSWIWGMW